MKVKYFKDTDTAVLEFSDSKIFDTLEINENVYVDVDENNRLVCITIEHANSNAKLPEFSYEEIEEKLIAS